jgi:hypothetical protein
MLKTATIRSPRAFAFRAAATLVQGVCSSFEKRNRTVRAGAAFARALAISRMSTVPMALSLAPGESTQLCESLCATTTMISSGRERPLFSA